MTPRSARSDRGFTLLDILFVIAIMGTLASIAIPGLMRARGQAGIASAIASMRAINSAQLTYAITCASGFYAPDLTTLGTAPPGSQAAFISPDLGSANTVIKSDYLIQMSGIPIPGSPASCNGVGPGGSAAGYKAAADPQDPPITRFFGTNANGTIFESPAPLFPVMPEAGAPAGATPIQ